MYSGLASNPMANPQAGLMLFALALKEAELEGIEPILQLLQQPSPQMAAMGGGVPGGVPGGAMEGPTNTQPPVPPSALPVSVLLQECVRSGIAPLFEPARKRVPPLPVPLRLLPSDC
jgi:hypothetical protein